MSGDAGGDLGTITFLWQHEDGSKWIIYSLQHQGVINKAYNKGQKTVTLPSKDSKKSLVNFDKMCQKNKISGWEQRIRCCVFDDDFFVWEWKDEYGNWECHPPDVSLDLESAFKDGKVVKFSMKDEDFEADLKALKQTNITSGSECDIQRQKVDVALTPELKSIGDQCTASVGLKRKADINGDSSSVDKPAIKKAKVKKEPKAVVKNETPAKNSSITYEFSGKVPVDGECELAGKAHVYSDGTGPYDVMLNQTNLQNNNNKYYVIQLLEEDARKKYYVFTRWGRVGVKGQTNLLHTSDISEAKKAFEKKFQDKTKNSWCEKNCFVKVPGKYDLVKIDYGVEEKEIKKKQKTKSAVATSSLEPKVADLMRMISNIQEMKKHIVEMKFDVLKLPLGKLTKDQVKAGYAALKKIEEALKKNQGSKQLLAACNDFYTRIPHNFGMKTPPIIRTMDEIEEKVQLLEALSNVEIAMKIEKESSAEQLLDGFYKSIQCEITTLDPKSEIFKLIDESIRNTHGPTHTAFTMEILTAYECNKKGEEEKFIDCGNKNLLWHGSRLTNFVGILKNGLLIAPKEAPCTGYMFGKGIYFADMSSKSSNYCYPTRQNKEGLLLLCEVARGEENIVYSANYDSPQETARKGLNSVKALGKYEPDPKGTKLLSGLKLCCGKPVIADRGSNPLELIYNEYVIYHKNQVKIRYIVHIKFNFK